MSRKNKIALLLLFLLFASAISNALLKHTATKGTSSERIDANVQQIKAQPSDEEELEEAQPMNSAPDFKLTTLEGNSISLSDYAGKKVLLNFWATWCPPCNAEAPHLQTIYEQYAATGVEIIAVNVTSQEKGRGKDTIPQFVQQYGLTFPIALDIHEQAASMYQILTLPTTYFIDEEGAIIEKVSGPMDERLMHEILYEMDNS